MPFFRCLLLPALAIAPLALAQTNPDLDPVVSRADAESLATAYASIINFAVSPEISTARFAVDAGEDVIGPDLKATRLPYRKVFERDGDSWRPFVQVVAAFQEMDAGFRVTADDFIDTRWNTYGLSLGGGVEVPVSENFDFVAGANVGWGRLENSARYAGPLQAFFSQALDGVVFNWELEAVVYGAAAGGHYERQVGDTGLEIRTGLIHHRIRSQSTSTDLVEFDSHVTTFDVDFNVVLPTERRLGQYPLAVVGILGNTTFLGHQREALGFNSFYEAGLALDIDLTARNWRLKKLRVGAKAIFGADVSGWGLIIGPGT